MGAENAAELWDIKVNDWIVVIFSSDSSVSILAGELCLSHLI